GLWLGMLNAAWETAVGGRSPWTLKVGPDWCSLDKLDGDADRAERAAGDYVARDLPPRDRLAGVYFAATEHDEDQPVHLIVHDTNICVTRCAVEYDNPCQRFCPAAVYEMVPDAGSPSGKRLQINASNCVHCKTCDIMDPYQIITWVPPEGGGGPNYGKM
ncbi:MAG: 4Fe-4S dicluster domain-containing protein, partial [Gammaproteobacteria bacterium]